MSPAVVSQAENITEFWGEAEDIQKAVKDAEDTARNILSQEDKERELRVAGELIDSFQKFAEHIISAWDRMRSSIRAGEVGEKDLLTTERVLQRIFQSGEFTFTTVRGLIHRLQSLQLRPSGVDKFEAAASRLAAAREDFAECYADLKDPRLQESIRKGFDEAMRATGEPWDWEQELFGSKGK